MKNKKKNKYMLLLILLLAISIGYAALSTTLKINGSATVSKNNWSVYWSNVQVTPGSVDASTNIPSIGQDANDPVNTKVTWSTTLNLPGDFYEFTVDATNNGSIDAMITGINPTVTPALESYISYTVTYDDGIAIGENHLLPKKTGNTATVQTYKVRIEFLDTITPAQMNAIPEEGLSYTFTYEVTYGQATDAAVNKPVFALPQGKTVSTLVLGDELCVQDQCFNFIKYDGDNAVMFAKYSLDVDESSGAVSQDVNPNLWDSYSTVNYWSGEESYPVDIYDAVNYAAQPDKDSSLLPTNPNYSMAYYVEQYKTRLTNDYHVTIEEARLLTYNEAVNVIGCTFPTSYSQVGSVSCPTTGNTSFITNSDFVLGTASSSTEIYAVNKDGYTYSKLGYNHSLAGTIGDVSVLFNSNVRPIIVVAKSNL